MSVILQPQVAFPLVRQIANHLDGTTYYVRAVVRNAAGTTIDTVDLASQGGQRYSSSWRVPVDGSGQGTYISITTSVYTDSGYTTKSESYGDEETTYLIFDRVMPAMRGGGNAGGGVDAYTVRRIVREELEKVEKPEKVEMPEMRFDEVLDEVREVKEAVERKAEFEATDLTPIHEHLERIEEAIEAKPVTEQPDLMPVAQAISEEAKAYRMDMNEVRQLLGEAVRVIQQTVPELVDKALQEMNFEAKTLQIKPTKGMKREEVEELDVTKLSI